MVVVAMALTGVGECVGSVTGYGFRVMLSTRAGGEIPVFAGFCELFARHAALEGGNTLQAACKETTDE